MPGPNRKRYLKELVGEYIDSGVGAHSWRDIVDKLIDDGHITLDELARDYGLEGFQRSVIRPVQKERDAAGRDKYATTKSGGIVQITFAELDDVTWVYYTRKHHISASQTRLEVLRQQIIDLHGVDPEDLPDPLEGKDVEVDD